MSLILILGAKLTEILKNEHKEEKNITFTFSKEKYPFKEFLKLHFTGNLGSIMSHILNHGLGDNQYSILKAERHTKKSFGQIEEYKWFEYFRNSLKI